MIKRKANAFTKEAPPPRKRGRIWRLALVFLIVFACANLVLSSGVAMKLKRIIVAQAETLRAKNEISAARIQRLEQHIQSRQAVLDAIKKTEKPPTAALADYKTSFVTSFSHTGLPAPKTASPSSPPPTKASPPLEGTGAAKQEHERAILKKPFNSAADEALWPTASFDNEVMDARSSESVRAVILKHKPAIQNLYLRKLKNQPALAGRLTVRFSVSAAGHLIDPAIVSSTLNAPELEGEILKIMLRWKDFGESAAAGETMRYRITFNLGVHE